MILQSFTIRDGQFRIDDRPIFLQAGEFHYFRAPADQWAHRLGLLRDAGFNAVATYIPWLWHQPQPDVSDLDGHSHPLRNLAGFLDLAADMGFWIIARPGPYIMAETINEGIPEWVFAQHPQAAYIAQDGAVQNIASYLQPDFIRCVAGWYDAVFGVLAPRQITHGGKIVLIQLDNEMGMLQWVRNMADINPDTLARFADFLHAPDRAETLRDRLTNAQAPDAARVLADYRRFYRSYLRDYTALLWEMARSRGMDVPPVINIHGFGNGGKTFPIGLSQLREAMAIDGMISATDVYPLHIDEGNFHQLLLVNAMTAALHNPAQPLFSIEFQAGGNQDFSGAQSSLYDLHSRLSIAVGMRGINHYLFFDGENDPILSPHARHDWGHPVRKDGTLRSHYRRYPELSRVLAAYGDALVQSRSETTTTIGFVLDQFMTEVSNAATKPATDILTHQRDVILFDFIARGLALTHRPFDAIDLTRADLNVARTPTLWTMLDKQCDAAIQQKLVDYARQGGRLVIVGRLPDRAFDDTPCTILADAFGVRQMTSDPPFTEAQIVAFEYGAVPVRFLETYTGDFESVFARSAAGQPVGFTQPIGSGRVMVLGAAFAANTRDDLDILHQMATAIGCAPAFTMTEWADVRRSSGENGDFLFVNNYRDDPIETVISTDRGPLFGGNPVVLPARRGAILPLDWQAAPGVTLHHATSEIIAMIEDGDRLILKTQSSDCDAEVSTPDAPRTTHHVTDGAIEFTRRPKPGNP